MQEKGIIYYTANKISGPIIETAKKHLRESDLPITSCSLKPIDLGENILFDGKRSYPTMVNQIVTALENSKAKYVFFAEDDVLYHKSHFNFIPPKDDVFYYNKNVWRWWCEGQKAIRYDRMLPLSCMCANREFALEHYKMRQKKIIEWGLDEFRSREPRKARIWGYEPGTKKKRRGGFTDDDFDTWCSEYPNIDIRHRHTFSSPKIHLKDFKHKPTNWEEINIDQIIGWDLKKYYEIININS